MGARNGRLRNACIAFAGLWISLTAGAAVLMSTLEAPIIVSYTVGSLAPVSAYFVVTGFLIVMDIRRSRP